MIKEIYYYYYYYKCSLCVKPTRKHIISGKEKFPSQQFFLSLSNEAMIELQVHRSRLSIRKYFLQPAYRSEPEQTTRTSHQLSDDLATTTWQPCRWRHFGYRPYVAARIFFKELHKSRRGRGLVKGCLLLQDRGYWGIAQRKVLKF